MARCVTGASRVRLAARLSWVGRDGVDRWRQRSSPTDPCAVLLGQVAARLETIDVTACIPHPQACPPNRAPITAVTAIASAPQKVTRIAAFSGLARPIFAPTTPSSARDSRDAIATA